MQSNLILPTLQNRAARLNRNRPTWQVVPNKSDNECVEAARLGADIMEYIWRDQNMDSKRLECSLWRQQIGHCYFKVNWDPTLGDELSEDPETGEVIMSGDIRIDVVAGFEVFPDPLATTERDAQWLIHAKTRPLSYFKSQYENGEEVKEEGLWLLSQQYQARINNMTAQGPSNSGVQSLLKDCAIEVCYYEAKSKKYPRGRQITGANGVILEEKKLPVGKIPFVRFDDIMVAGKYYPESLVTHLRPMQDQMNRILSSRAEWTNLMLKGKYLAARGHGLQQEALNDRNGEVVEYDAIPGHVPPQALPCPTIPSYAYQEEQSIRQQVNDISGLSEVSRGTIPAGAGNLPAIGMQMLTEADETRLSVITRRDEENFGRLGSLCLRFVGEFVKVPHILKIAGENMEYTVKDFLGADLRGNYDVRVQDGSTLPQSMSQKRADVSNIVKMFPGILGNITDPKVATRILKMLEFGDTSELFRDYGLDMHQIQESIEGLCKGKISPPSEFDNNSLHIVEKNRFRKTQKFDALDTNAKTAFNTDIEARLRVLMAQANPQLAAQAETAPMQNQLMVNQMKLQRQQGNLQTETAKTAALRQASNRPAPNPGQGEQNGPASNT